jgi:predicted TIM-barrel fold metal-dependent hydrolase
MKIDMHVHLADIELLLASRQEGRISHSTRHLTRILQKTSSENSTMTEGSSLNERWIKCLIAWVRESQLDKIVLLAMDAVFDESGNACPERTVLHVDNEFVCSVAAEQPEFIFGASIHPYRKDAIVELERLIKKGARLIKWIPSGQYIEPDNSRCYPFYEALSHYGIPLLSHTGMEHTLGTRRLSFNHPERLVPALKKGVTVFAAHCGVHLFLHEPSFFKSWALLAKEHENLYGDSGAFSIVTRIPCLRQILKDKALRDKLIYGSDFPGIPSPLWCWQLGFKKMRELSGINNPLERNMRVMQALNIPPEVFERTHKLLHIKEEILSNDR